MKVPHTRTACSAVFFSRNIARDPKPIVPRAPISLYSAHQETLNPENPAFVHPKRFPLKDDDLNKQQEIHSPK